MAVQGLFRQTIEAPEGASRFRQLEVNVPNYHDAERDNHSRDYQDDGIKTEHCLIPLF